MLSGKYFRAVLAAVIGICFVLGFGGFVYAEGISGDNIDNGIPVVYITIDESEGHNTIDAMNSDKDHKTTCDGTMSITVPAGFHYSDMPDLPCESVEDIAMTIRGRGNTTWYAAKKPYKIKLGKNVENTNIFGLGENRHWVLIANAYDETLIKDRMTGWLGDRIGFEFTPRGVPVDLVMRNTEGTYNRYLGSYYFSENVRVDKNRLEIDELKEEDTEASVITGGYLVQGGSQTDPSSPDLFSTESGESWATHTPSFDTNDDGYENDAQMNYIHEFMQKVEDLLFTEGFTDETGTRYSDLMDLDSAAKYYLIDLVSKNSDGYGTGSTYVYKKRDPEGGTGKLYWGPLWDFDYAWPMYDTPKNMEVRHEWVTAMAYDRASGGFIEKVKEAWPDLKAALAELTADGGVIDRYYEETKASKEKDLIANPPDDQEYFEGDEQEEGGEEQLAFSDDYKGSIDRLKSWIDRRAQWVDENLYMLDDIVHKIRFNVDGELYNLRFIQDGHFLAGTGKYPEKDDYVFIGWKNENGDLVDDEYLVTEDHDLEAVYIPEEEATAVEDIVFKRAYDIIGFQGDGTGYAIDYTLLPEDAQNKKIEWSSQDESIATVEDYGFVTLHSLGDVWITAKLKSGKTKNFLLRSVPEEEIEMPYEIWPDKELYNLVVGEQAQLSISSAPNAARIDDYEYESENEDVATAEDGFITAKSPGQTRIKVTTYTYEDTDYYSDPIECETYVTVNVFEDENTPILNITKQPESVDVEYPAGAEFSIKVDHPENVRSYQWELRVYSIEGTSSFNVYKLTGSSATTNKLIVPSTESGMHPQLYRCIVTDINGKKHISDEAAMTITNADEKKPVLYVGEYALEPGESLDLETTDLGSGIVTYDANSFDITFKDLDLENSHPVYDSDMAACPGIFLSAEDTIPIDERLEYRMHFKGKARINNKYFDPAENTGGVCVNTYFNAGREVNKPTLVVDGDDVITITGGKHSFYVDNGSFELNCDIRTLPLNLNYCDAITAENSVIIDEGVKADINCCGAALVANGGDIRVFKGAKLNIDAAAPHISKGLAALSVIRSAGSIYFTGAEVNVRCKGMPEDIVPYNSSIAMFNGISYSSNLTLDASGLSVDMSTKHWPERFANNFYGISGEDYSALEMKNGSSIDLNIDVPEVNGASGAALGQNVLIEQGCSLRAYIRSGQRAYGLTTDGALTVNDADIDISTESLAEEGDPSVLMRGIYCGKASIDITDSSHNVKVKTAGGAAFVAGGEERVDDPVGYTADYKPEYILLKNKARTLVPADGVISGYSYELESRYVKAETIYSKASTEAPVKSVNIGMKKANPMTVRGNSVTIRSAKLKKRAQTIKRAKAITKKNSKGKVTYKLKLVKKAKFRKYFKVAAKTGKITVKKGLKKGTYRLRVRVRAAGTAFYNPKARTVTVKVKVR